MTNNSENYMSTYSYMNEVELAFELAFEENNIDALIKLHKKLIGKFTKHMYKKGDYECGVYFVVEILGMDDGKVLIFDNSDIALAFIKSSYLSNYFKDSIKKLLEGNLDNKLANILNSSKDINDMSEEEIKTIKLAIDKYYSNPNINYPPNIAASFMIYLYKLDGEGVTCFIKNNINNIKIATQYLFTSGLNPSARIYSGRGVTCSDLSVENLVSIFNKLRVLDIGYAVGFVSMVNSMKTLGATEFINSFYQFAENGFIHYNENINNDNISLDGLYGSARDVGAFVSIISAFGRDEDSQVMLSNNMKENFITKLEPFFTDLAFDILKASGIDLSKKSRLSVEVYSNDLSIDNLVAIFEKIVDLDVSFATEFVSMVNNMNLWGILDIWNFVKCFYRFAINGFRNVDESDINNKRSHRRVYVTYNGPRSLGFSKCDTSVELATEMKECFMERIRPILNKVAPNFTITQKDTPAPYTRQLKNNKKI